VFLPVLDPAVLPTEVPLGWGDERRAVGELLFLAVEVHFDHGPGLVHVGLVRGLDVRTVRGGHDALRYHRSSLDVLGRHLDRQCCKKDRIPLPRLLEKDM
jgi:hypothetical protein